jgi:hypothetical protein
VSYDPKLIAALEPGQLSAATTRPLPRRKLGWGAVALLVLLRVYILIAIPIVCYAFVHAILAPK